MALRLSGLGQARQAFDDAVKEFREHIPERNCATWLNNSTIIYDVEEAVKIAKQKYEGMLVGSELTRMS
jgi:hypothetical protein